jgi:hypothetical protein
MDLDLFCLIVSFKIPSAVGLSVLHGVAGCVCPNSVRVDLIGAPLWAFWKQAPTSDSAADATTFFRTEFALRIEPLSLSAWGGGVVTTIEQSTQSAAGVGH